MGLTRIEICVLIGVVAIGAALLLPFVQGLRESARRMQCSNHFREIGLAVQAYHSAHNVLPMHGTGATNEFENDWRTADDFGPMDGPPKGYTMFRLSFLVGILPFLERQSLWDQIVDPSTDSHGHSWPEMGPSPVTIRYEPWASDIPVYRCPSDPGRGLPAIGRTNVAACTGDATSRSNLGSSFFGGSPPRWQHASEPRLNRQVSASQRGIFVPRKQGRFSDVLDGLSNTILAGEIATDLGDRDVRTDPVIDQLGTGDQWGQGIMQNPSTCRDNGHIDPERPQFWLSSAPTSGPAAKRGFRWADFYPAYSQFKTILPPNGELCNGGGHSSDSTAPASSRHPGGCHVLLADGAVEFISDSIDAGDSRAPTVWRRDNQLESPNRPDSESPYGLWGALGTRASEQP